MFTKLTEPRTPTRIPTPKRHKHKSLIGNHPDRESIAFLIDTAAIRNGHNSCKINETCFSNRYKIGLFDVPYDGAVRQSASVPGELLYPVSTRNTLGNRNHLKTPAINDIIFSTRNKTGGGRQPKISLTYRT
jgi:hypothetical protein